MVSNAVATGSGLTPTRAAGLALGMHDGNLHNARPFEQVMP